MSSLTAEFLLPSQRLPSLSLPTLTPCEATGLWEVAWETCCASFPGSRAGLLRWLARVQQAEPSLELGFQPSPHTCAVRRAETSVVGSCFRSHLCVEATWLGTTGCAKKNLFFFLIFFPLVDSLTRPRGTLGATSLLRAEQILMLFVQGENYWRQQQNHLGLPHQVVWRSGLRPHKKALACKRKAMCSP